MIKFNIYGYLIIYSETNFWSLESHYGTFFGSNIRVSQISTSASSWCTSSEASTTATAIASTSVASASETTSSITSSISASEATASSSAAEASSSVSSISLSSWRLSNINSDSSTIDVCSCFSKPILYWGSIIELNISKTSILKY